MIKFLSKLVHDQIGEVDEKRVAGVISWATGFLFALVGGIIVLATGKTDLTATVLTFAGFLIGAGTLGFAGAIIGDQGRLGAGESTKTEVTSTGFTESTVSTPPAKGE